MTKKKGPTLPTCSRLKMGAIQPVQPHVQAKTVVRASWLAACTALAVALQSHTYEPAPVYEVRVTGQEPTADVGGLYVLLRAAPEGTSAVFTRASEKRHASDHLAAPAELSWHRVTGGSRDAAKVARYRWELRVQRFAPVCRRPQARYNTSCGRCCLQPGVGAHFTAVSTGMRSARLVTIGDIDGDSDGYGDGSMQRQWPALPPADAWRGRWRGRGPTGRSGEGDLPRSAPLPFPALHVRELDIIAGGSGEGGAGGEAQDRLGRQRQCPCLLSAYTAP